MEPINKIFSDLMQMPFVRAGFILAGITIVIVDFNFKPSVNFIALGIVKTLAVIIWGRAALCAIQNWRLHNS